MMGATVMRASFHLNRLIIQHEEVDPVRADVGDWWQQSQDEANYSLFLETGRVVDTNSLDGDIAHL